MHVIPKETLKKPDRSDLELSAEMEPAPSPCMAECCSLWGRNGKDRVDLGSVLWKRGVCSVPVLLGSSVRLSGSTRSWPGVEQPSSSPC